MNDKNEYQEEDQCESNDSLNNEDLEEEKSDSSNEDNDLEDDLNDDNESEDSSIEDHNVKKANNLKKSLIEKSNSDDDLEDNDKELKNNEEELKDDKQSDDDDAPEELDFESTKKTALQLAKTQMNVLNRLKKQQQEKRKLAQQRNIEQKKQKILRKEIEMDDDLDELDDNYLNDELINKRKNQSILELERETENSKLKFILNDNDQIDKLNTKLIKKYKETNNRMISFKDRTIQSNQSIKRLDSNDINRLLHKKKFK